MPIDSSRGINYDRAKQKGPALKAALTRAKKQGYPAVLGACKAAVAEWEVWNAWPDNWSNWQRALDDAAFAHSRAGGTLTLTRLEEL